MVDPGGRARQVDLDELARSEEERDFLLRSIADLDREHEAGDVDPSDYEELRRGYVARAADAIRAVDAGVATLDRERSRSSRRRGRGLAWGGAVVVFTVVAGVLLANALGSRGENDILTGAGSMPGDDVARCRTLSMSTPAEGVECYDDLLVDRPDDVEALTYGGWARVRSGDVAGGSAAFDRVVELDPTYPDVHVFRSSVLKNAGDFAGAAAELETLYALNPSPIIVSTLQQMGLDREVALGLLPADVQECWKQEEAAINAVSAASSADEPDQSEVAGALADVAISVRCLDDTVLSVRPADADALTFRALGMGILGAVDDSSITRAEANATSALDARPDDPTALALRATLRSNLGDIEGAAADVAALGDRRISPLIATYVDLASLKAQVAAAQAAAPSSVTTTSTP